MTQLRQLTPREVFFIGGETSTVYQHTAGLSLLDASDLADYGFEAFRRHMQTHIDNIPQFRWKLHEVAGGLDLPYWVEDRNFNLNNHIRRIGIPSPGDDRALAELVSYIYCRHLNRDRPLWEAWFIEGLADGRYAFLQKMHHCMADGEGAVRMADALWDHEPCAPASPVDQALAHAEAGAIPGRWQESLNSAMHLGGLPLAASREIYQAIRQNIGGRLQDGSRKLDRQAAPPTCFNGDITAARGLAFVSLPLAQIKAVKDAFGATVNDVVLALVSTCLRNFLADRGELPEEALRTSIAVSLREETDDEFSNRVTATSVTLATQVADPVERLQAIGAETSRAKETAHRGDNHGLLEFMQLLPPFAVNALTRLTPGEQIPKLMGVNLVVSNVRGSETPMYIGGARLEATYPMSIITPGGGLNVTCFSYAGSVHFGLTVEPNMIPDPWELIEGLQAALAEYTGLVKKRRRPAGKRKGR